MERIEPLPLQRIAALDQQQPEQQWLIKHLWAEQAVGMIGGPPKCCKSWLGLDMALSVASGTPCLGRFAVTRPGPALVYLAEDALPAVRARVAQMCQHRALAIETLDLFALTMPTLRLDRHEDQQRLHATLAALKPRFLLLDPLVRLHCLDENSAADISRLLGFVRTLQRTHDTAIALVHHASKKHRAQPGQALRGSSDLHAFGDSNAYLARRHEQLILTLEHRAAEPPKPMTLALVSHGEATHLAMQTGAHPDTDLAERVLALLKTQTAPTARTKLRECLKVNNQRLGLILDELQQQGQVLRTPNGWSIRSELASGTGAHSTPTAASAQ